MGSGINRHMLHNGVRDTQRDAAQWGQAYTGRCCTMGSGLHRHMLHKCTRGMIRIIETLYVVYGTDAVFELVLFMELTLLCNWCCLRNWCSSWNWCCYGTDDVYGADYV